MNVGSNKKGCQTHFDCYHPSATRAIGVRSAPHVQEKIVDNESDGHKDMRCENNWRQPVCDLEKKQGYPEKIRRCLVNDQLGLGVRCEEMLRRAKYKSRSTLLAACAR